MTSFRKYAAKLKTKILVGGALLSVPLIGTAKVVNDKVKENTAKGKYFPTVDPNIYYQNNEQV